MIEKFTSLLNHVCNIYSWLGSKCIHKCEHNELNPEDSAEVDWIVKDSNDYRILNSIIRDKVFLGDLRQAKHYCHTGSLESYHNVRLKYVPKRNSFSYDGMVCRSMLAIFDHNSNVGREVKGEQLKFSKATKKWVIRNKYEKKSTEWRKRLLGIIFQIANTEMTSVEGTDRYAGLGIPRNIAPVERPNIEDIRKSVVHRFGGASTSAE